MAGRYSGINNQKRMIMKKLISFSMACLCSCLVFAQTYPDPEFSNEVYYLKKDNSTYALVRLEKGSAKQTTKANMIKAEYSYTIEGKTSTVRFAGGKNFSFVFSTAAGSSNASSDSAMRANGMDPNMMTGATGDPSNMINLYKLDVDKEERKIYLMKSGGAFSFGKKANQSSNKYSFSVKKIRDGYWELVVDKALPKGEYAFSIMGMTGSDYMSDSQTVFAFAID
jgi:hypothetical protein